MTRPWVTSCNLLTVRIAVDLPDPDKPMTTKISPFLTSKEMSFMPTTWPVWRWTSSLLTPEEQRSKARPRGLGPKIL